MKNIKIFKKIRMANFIDRPNRFIVNCDLDGKKIRAFLPNPGRLQELFFPGIDLYITHNPGDETKKTEYTVVGVIKNGFPVMLHTHKSNHIVKLLIKEKLIPTLEDASIKASEVVYKNSRFDFLLNQGGKDFYLEVKSCTLFGERIAMFPDAVTERGRRHIEELSHMGEEAIKPAVLFLVHYYKAEFFMPDYHTDLLFGKTFLKCRHKINFLPVAVKWEEDLSLSGRTKLLKIPWEIIQKEGEDRGSYLIVMELKEENHIKIGSLGTILFKAGYYVYTGSAMTNLSQRIRRHYRLRKNYHWHIDYLRQEVDIITDLPVRSSERLECIMAEEVLKISDFYIPKFGSSDCLCPSHLFGFMENPMDNPDFIKIIQYFRIDRLPV